MHLITITNKKDASAVAHAVSVRFAYYTVNTVEETEMSFVSGYKITAEYINDAKYESDAVSTYAQAFYAGLVYGKQEALIEAKASIADMLELANPHHPRHDKARE